MRQLILALLITISSAADAQINKVRWFVLSNSTGSAPAPTYEWNPIDTAAFTPTTTLTYSGSGSINSAAISGHNDIGLDGVWNRVRIDGITSLKRFVNADAATQIGNRDHADWENWISFDAINGSNNIEVWGKSITEPFWIDGNDNGGMAWIGGGHNSVVKVRNVIATRMGWASLFMNGNIHYRYVDVAGFRNFGAPNDGEGTYFGITDKTTFYLYDSLKVKDFITYGRGRDGIQANNHWKLNYDGITVHNVGIADMSGQRALVQFQNARGFLSNSILHDAPSFGVVAGHGLVFYNNYFRWNSGALILQNISTEYASAPADSVVGRNRLPLFFINNDFDPETSTNVITAQDSEADVVMINNRYSTNVSATFSDGRGDTGTHSLQDIGAETGVTFTEPTYTNFDSADYDNHGKAIDAYTYGKARGFRTKDSRKTPIPTFDIVSVSTLADIEAQEGTAFEDLTLPAVVQVSIDGPGDPINVKLPVVWAEGSYDGDVQDTYTLTGTFYLPTWYIIKNPSTLTATVDVNVVEPYFNAFTDIAWTAAFNPLDYNGTTWTNQGTGSNASQGSASALPTYTTGLTTRSGSGVVFTNSPQTGLQYTSGTVTEPFETWIEIITPSSFTGTQRIYANGSATRCTINSSGQILVAGTSDVSTGLTLSTNTRYVLRIVNNGASSSITANNGTPLTFTITAQNGSSTPKIGHAYSAGSGHVNMTLGDLFQKSGLLDAGQQTSMWDWFGF